MAEQSMNDTLDPGEFRFVDNYIPELAAGHYTIKVEQRLDGSGSYNAHRLFTAEQEFTVRGPRFNLDPSDVYAMFPPPNSQGVFGLDLPHIVLTKRALPWERNIFGEKTIPWMALLLFDPSGILPPVVGTNVGSPSPSRVTTIKVKVLKEGQVEQQSNKIQDSLDKAEPKTKVGDYAWDTMDPEELEQLCQVIDITPDIFTKVMPKREDLKYLAHCREVAMARKAVPGPGRPGDGVAPGNGIEWYSVVVGGRFPSSPSPGQPGKLYVAHLVSLEGFDKYLGNIKKLSGFDRIRLVSLASWTFTCLPEKGESFSELMLSLVAGDGREALEFKLPAQQPSSGATAEESFAFKVLKAGYVPCIYQPRQGEQTFAWYRGPFTPQPVARFSAERPPFVSSSQAMIHDQAHDLFDLSYAVAWETGRLLAFSDQRFGLALLNLRRKVHRMMDQLSESGLLRTGLTRESALLPHDQTTDETSASDASVSGSLDRFAATIKPEISKTIGTEPTGSGSTIGPKADYGTQLVELQQDENTRELFEQASKDEYDLICEWLAHLYLLYGMPFNNLVPDERLLPPESIRFFYLDRNWLNVLLEGAISIGMHSSRDTAYQNQMFRAIIDEVHQRVHNMRDGLLGNHNNDEGRNAGQRPLAGLLLRSAVVSGWPGLEVRAYASSDGKTGSGPIGLLRMDRPSADVLFCLFDQVPAWIEFNEPKEGLHFGVEGIGGKYQIGLRYLKGENTGKLTGKTVELQFDEHRKLNIQDLLKDINHNLGCELSPADFALQMIDAREQMVFQRAFSRS